MGMDFTNLRNFKSDETIPLDPDEQVCAFVQYLNCSLKEGYFVIAPTPNKRVLYYELSGNNPVPKSVHGYQEYLRDLMTGNKQLGQEEKKVRRNKNG